MAEYSICKIDGCANPQRTRGLCSAHYQRQKKFGDPQHGGPVAQVPIVVCAHDGCKSIANIGAGAKGFCSKHYQRFKKFGDGSVSLLDRETSVCKVEGCGRGKPLSSGLCQKHYVRLKIHGTTDLPKNSRSGRKIRWMQEHASYGGDDCLIWPFTRNDTGRGMATINGKNTSAPRAMCILAHGEPPSPNHHAAHTCGKGHEGCVNPRHLRWATPQENERDKEYHGTLRKGSEINTSRLSEADVTAIREHLAKGEKGAALARQYGVSAAAISSIRNRHSWAWLD
jgi:hypothetical protein